MHEFLLCKAFEATNLSKAFSFFRLENTIYLSMQHKVLSELVASRSLPQIFVNEIPAKIQCHTGQRFPEFQEVRRQQN